MGSLCKLIISSKKCKAKRIAIYSLLRYSKWWKLTKRNYIW